MNRLENKIAIVVGAGQAPGASIGNGRATAIRFAQEGAKVHCVDMNLDSAQETAELIEKEGGEASAVSANIVDEADCKSIISSCLSAYDRIDILHNNVGIGVANDNPLEFQAEAWTKVMNVNLLGVMTTCKYALPIMIEQGHGVITNISSLAAGVAPAALVTYSVSKAGLNAYTQSLANAYAKHGIRVNCIMPGLIETPMAVDGFVAATGFDRKEVIAARNDSVPLKGGMGSAWDIANASLFLASDEAKFISGVILPVDGGQLSIVGGG